MTPAEILRAARARLSDPVHWCQRASARDATGVEVDETDPRACAWCAVGAIRAAHPGIETSHALILLERVIDTGSAIADWNDALHQGHACVLQAFARAIELAEAEAEVEADETKGNAETKENAETKGNEGKA